MDKSLFGFRIYTSDSGNVVITQDTGREENVVILKPEQIPLLVSWLKEAASEIYTPEERQ
jgi:hypothetical protein